MEALVTRLASSLRKHGFRPFRPLEISRQPNESIVSSRITGLREVAVRLRLPWQPKEVSCALSIELQGRRLLQKRLEGFSSEGYQVIYDATVTISGGVAIFKDRRWRTMRRAKFNNLVPYAVDRIIDDLKATAAPNAAAAGFLFDPF
jgi:hypothetical protein